MEQIPEDRVDFAVLEKSSITRMVKAEFSWTDLCSFDSLINYDLSNEEVGLFSPMKGVDCEDSFSFTSKDVFVAPGLGELVLIESDDCFLILKRGESEVVKQVRGFVKDTEDKLL